MRLADFIDEHAEEILAEAERFARTFHAGSRLSAEELRDHIPLILKAVVKDLRPAQTAEHRLRKSQGEAPPAVGAETAAQTHALLRAKGGFNIEQVVAEYRALRASVLQLWACSGTSLEQGAFEDIIRFGEAIDQAVAESTANFSAEVDRMRHIFLGILGHDLRGPLNAILLTSQVLLKLASSEPLQEQTSRLIRSGERMKRLLDDLLDYSRFSLGVGIDMERVPVDLASACREEIDILRSAWPRLTISFEASGPTMGSFDASRVREALSNLVNNAASHGTAGASIHVRLLGDGNRVSLLVENDGPPVEAENLSQFFEPLKRGLHGSEVMSDRSHLGLGLFIVSEIAKAHGGTVQASSSDGRTTFGLILPNAI
jgi:signal transduction histidine kinase